MKISYKKIQELEQFTKNSFYLVDLDLFIRNYNAFLSAGRNFYYNFDIAYSYKANYIPTLCKILNSQGAYAEVVSEMEYELALKIGVPKQKIIINGPFHTKAFIKKALFGESIFNFDSWYQIDILKEISEENPKKKIKIGIRLNFDISKGVSSRFGFDTEDKSLKNLLLAIDNINNCTIFALHCHFCENARDVDSYMNRSLNIIKIYKEYFAKYNIKYINLGGGFFSNMPQSLKNQFNCYIPTFTEYAEAFASPFASNFNNTIKPKLFIEPGQALVADTTYFISKVIDIKSIKRKKFVLVNGSIYNIKPTKNKKNLPIKVINYTMREEKSKSAHSYDIVGYTCMEDDIMYYQYRGNININDYIIFYNVGAYSFVLKPPFIMPCPPIIAHHNGDFKIIKRQEIFNDIFKTYAF